MRDVQRNVWRPFDNFSLVEFLFAVVRDVQRNTETQTRDMTAEEFLFAVVRDVQRNPTPSETPADLRK